MLRRDTDELIRIAAEMHRTGHRYQGARTLVLAGGATALGGQAELAAIGAVPMTT
ncbi:MAG TPA: hypothetical protein VHN36_03920 [Ilumatobacteraceae bacterium]|nr:hypothetical protein [Ilumatobacteraceae bacterium]